MLAGGKVSRLEYLVYGELLNQSNRDAVAVNRKRKTLAKYTGYAVRTITAATSALAAKGLIGKRQRRRHLPDGRWVGLSSTYETLDPPDTARVVTEPEGEVPAGTTPGWPRPSPPAVVGVPIVHRDPPADRPISPTAARAFRMAQKAARAP
jgi:hypothetical protein